MWNKLPQGHCDWDAFLRTYNFSPDEWSEFLESLRQTGNTGGRRRHESWLEGANPKVHRTRTRTHGEIDELLREDRVQQERRERERQEQLEMQLQQWPWGTTAPTWSSNATEQQVVLLQQQLAAQAAENANLRAQLATLLSLTQTLQQQNTHQQSQLQGYHNWYSTMTQYRPPRLESTPRQYPETAFTERLVARWKAMYPRATITANILTGEGRREADIVLECDGYIALCEAKMDTNRFCEAAGQVSGKYADYLIHDDPRYEYAFKGGKLSLFVACPTQPKRRELEWAERKLAVYCHWEEAQLVPWTVPPVGYVGEVPWWGLACH